MGHRADRPTTQAVARGPAADARKAAEAYRLLDTAVARLVTADGAGEFTLSVSCQAGRLQDVWLSCGRLSAGDVPAGGADAAAAARAVEDGGYGPHNARSYEVAREALATLLGELVRCPTWHGSATLVLKAEGGQLRVPIGAETLRKWRFGD